MTKIDRLDELYELDIDFSTPINQFAQKAKALLNRLGREMKLPYRSYAAEYGSGSARVFLTSYVSVDFIVKFDKEVRKLAREHKVAKYPLYLTVTDVIVGDGEINIDFN